MASDQTHLTLLFLFTLISPILSHSIIQQFTKPHLLFTLANTLYCDSWRFSVETNDAGSWSTIPEKCIDYVKDYMTGDRYISDSEVVADDSLEYAKTVELTGKDAWVFDIDETLLSNLPYYADKGFEWVESFTTLYIFFKFLFANLVFSLYFTYIVDCCKKSVMWTEMRISELICFVIVS